MALKLLISTTLLFLVTQSVPPRLVSFEWKTVDDLPTPFQWQTTSVVFFTATFDQNVTYNDPTCNWEEPDERIAFGSCLGEGCISGPGVYSPLVPLDPDSPQLLRFNIRNFETFFALSIAFRGDVSPPSSTQYAVTFPGCSIGTAYPIIPPLTPPSTTPWGALGIVDSILKTQDRFKLTETERSRDKDFGVTGHSFLLVACGSDIRNQCFNTSWNGDVILEVYNMSKIAVYDHPNATEIEDAFHKVPIGIEWGGIPLKFMNDSVDYVGMLNVTNESICTLDPVSKCLWIRPVPDPAEYYLNLLMNENPSSKQISTRNQLQMAIKLSTIDLLTNKYTTIVPDAFIYNFNNPSFPVTFSFPPEVGNANGEKVIIDGPVTPVLQSTKDCDAVEFSRSSEKLDAIIKNEPYRNLTCSLSFLVDISRITSNEDYLSCIRLLEGFLLNITGGCRTLIDGNTAFDPCCYPDLSGVENFQCCSYPIPQETQVVDSTLNSLCGQSQSPCVRQSLNYYSENILGNNAENDGLKAFYDARFYTNIMLPCFSIAYGYPCQADSDCGSGSCIVSQHTSLYQYCSVSCVRDSDCWPGQQCIVGKRVHSDDGLLTCSVSDFGKGVLDNGTDILSQCLATKLNDDNFLRLYLLQYFGMTERILSTENMTNLIRTYFIYEACNWAEQWGSNFSVTPSECLSQDLCNGLCDESAGTQVYFMRRAPFHTCCPNTTACCSPTDGYLCGDWSFGTGVCPQSYCINNPNASTEICYGFRCEVNGTEVCTNCTESNCDQFGLCNDDFGCIAISNTLTCPPPYLLTRYGCKVEISMDDCLQSGFQWIPKAQTRDECLSKLFYCNLTDPVNQLPIKNLYNETVCASCGGIWQNAFAWAVGNWVQTMKWQEYTSVPTRNDSTNGSFIAQYTNYDRFNDIWVQAKSMQLALILANYIAQRYGPQQAEVKQIACACGYQSSDTCFSQSAIFSSLEERVTACPGMPQNLVSGETVIIVSENFAPPGLECISISVSDIPLEQFTTYTVSAAFSTLNFLPISQRKRHQPNYIQNSNGVVVGSLIYATYLDINTTGLSWTDLSFCFDFPPDKPIPPNDIGLDTSLLSMVIYENEQFVYAPGFRNGDFYCLNDSLPPSGIIGLAAMLPNWQNIKFSQMFSSMELGLIIFGIVSYSIALLTAAGLFVTFKLGNYGSWSVAILILGFMFLFLANRVIFFVVLLVGLATPAGDILVVIFDQFSSLLFSTTLSVMVVKWAEVVHTPFSAKPTGISTLQPVLVGGNVLLYLICICLVLVYHLLPPKIVQYSCSSVPADSTAQAYVVGVIYAIFFALFSVILAILYIVYAWKVGRLLERGNRIRAGTEKTSSVKLAATASVAAFGLLMQAFLVLYIGSDNLPNAHGAIDFSSLALFLGLLMISELVPAIALMTNLAMTAEKNGLTLSAKIALIITRKITKVGTKPQNSVVTAIPLHS